MTDIEEYLEDLYAINKEALVKSEDPLELVYIDLRRRIDRIEKLLDKLEEEK